MSERRKTLAGRIGLVISGTIIAFLLVEICLRLFGLAPNRETETWDDRRSIVRDPEFRSFVETNTLGLRDHRELPRTGASRRILLLGDSFVFGVGVSNNETLAAVAEAWLNDQSPHSWTILNGGAIGLGTFGESRRLGDILDRIEVDGVVLFYFVENDPYDTLLEAREREGAAREGTEEILERVKSRNRSDAAKLWLRRNVALYRFLRLRLGTEGTLRAFPSRLMDQCEPARLESFRELDGLVADALTAVKARLDERRVPLLFVVIIPRQEQISDEEFARFAAFHGVDPVRYDRHLPQTRVIRSVLDPLQLDYVDLGREFEGRDPKDLYFRADGHFNVKGHAFVGNLIARRLATHYRETLSAASQAEPAVTDPLRARAP